MTSGLVIALMIFGVGWVWLQFRARSQNLVRAFAAGVKGGGRGRGKGVRKQTRKRIDTAVNLANEVRRTRQGIRKTGMDGMKCDGGKCNGSGPLP